MSEVLPKKANHGCRPCRKDRKKCSYNKEGDINEPGQDRWQKCENCEMKIRECGGPLEVPRKVRKRTATQIGHDKHSNATELSSSTVQPPDGSVESQKSGYRGDEQCIEQMDDCLAVQRILFRSRCDNRRLLQRLPDSDELKRRESVLKAADANLNAHFQNIVDEFDRQGRSTKSEELMTVEVLRLRFENGQLRHHYLGLDSHSAAQPVSKTPKWTGSSEMVACTRNIMQDIYHDTFKPREDVYVNSTTPPDDYVKVQGRLQSLGQQIFTTEAGYTARDRMIMSTADDSIEHTWFPAAQIAYMNFDMVAALKLVARRMNPGALGNASDQSLVHLVANAGDSGFWQRLQDLDKVASTAAAFSGGDYSPVNLAAILDNTDIFFSMARQSVAVYSSTEKTLHFAVSAKSYSIVDTILKMKTVAQPPYTKEMLIAIQLDDHVMAQKLVGSIHSWSPEDAQMLAEEAAKAGMGQVAEELYAHYNNIHQKAIATLDDHASILADGEPIYWGTSQHADGLWNESSQYNYPDGAQASERYY